MCGIVAYKGNRPTKIRDLIEIAYQNKHRGEDGIGIIYKDGDKKKYIKNLHSLTELHNGKLDKDYCVKRLKVGSFEYTTRDDDKYEEEQKKFEKYVEKIGNISTKFAYIHHRKATYGDITLENQHPILIGDKLYLHNGTAYLSDSVKRYLEVMEGLVFKSQTDTEVLATVYNRLNEYFKGDKEKVYNELSRIFSTGFGILIEVDEDGNVGIIKDCTRKLWYYQFEDCYMLVSEPYSPFVDYSDVGLIPNGYTDMNDVRIIPMLDKYNKAKEAWEYSYNGTPFYRQEKCEICAVSKDIKGSFHCEGHPIKDGKKINVCFECLCLWKDREGSKDVSDKEAKYGRYLGESEVIDIA